MPGKTQPTTNAILQGCGWLGALDKYRQPCALRIVMIRPQSTFSPINGDSLVYPPSYAETLSKQIFADLVYIYMYLIMVGPEQNIHHLQQCLVWVSR